MLAPVFSNLLNTDITERDSVLPTVLGGAGLFSLAPAITARPLQHYNKGVEISDFNKFQKKLRPGDILVSGSKELSPIPTGVNLVTGNPYGQHISIVDAPSRRFDIDSHPAYGFNITEGNIDKSHNLQVLRFKNDATRRRVLSEMRSMARATNKFESAVKRILVRKGWDPSSAASYAEVKATSSLYDTPTGVKAGLKELFLPNLTSAESVKNLNRQHYLANKTFANNVKSYAQNIAEMIDAHPKPENISAAELRKALPRCVGGVCSSMPAILGEVDIVPGRAARDILTSDYLKSDKLKPIMRYYGGRPETFLERSYFSAMAKAPRLLKSLPGLGLLGAGVGLALKNKRDKADRLSSLASRIKFTQPISSLLKNRMNAA